MDFERMMAEMLRQSAHKTLTESRAKDAALQHQLSAQRPSGPVPIPMPAGDQSTSAPAPQRPNPGGPAQAMQNTGAMYGNVPEPFLSGINEGARRTAGLPTSEPFRGGVIPESPPLVHNVDDLVRNLNAAQGYYQPSPNYPGVREPMRPMGPEEYNVIAGLLQSKLNH